MKCPNCNTENDDGSTLCAQCQTPLPKVEQAAQPASPADQTVYPSTQPAYLSVSPPPPPPPPKRSNAVTILLIVVVSVLIIGSAVGLVYYKSQTATQNANATSTANAHGQTQTANNNSTATAQLNATAIAGTQANIAATATAATATANAQPPTTTTSGLNLEDDASQWHIFIDNHGQGSATGATTNVSDPSVDSDKALKVSLINGDPYVGVQAYRNLAPANTATTFDLSLSFYLHSNSKTTAPIQALEFTMSKWVNGQRWEWALQWEHIGQGISPQDTVFPWRLWTGSNWQDIGVKQQFETEKWHTFHLKGNISSGGIQYISFSADNTQFSFDPQKFQPFQPVSVPTDQANKLSVAVQLDGDSAEDPYDVYIDGVDFRWS